MYVKRGIPLGVTFAFLITSPLVNEVAVAMFLASFGVRATAIYVVSGILLGTLGGMLLSRFRLERLLSPWVRQLQEESEREPEAWEGEHTPFLRRLPTIAFMMGVVGLSLPEAMMLKKVMTWRLVGIFFGVVTLFIILSGYLFNAML